MVAEELREVRDDLPLLLVLGQRAIAAIDLQARSKLDVPRCAGVVASYEYRRQTGAEFVEVEARDPSVGRALRAEVELQHVHLVLVEAEAQVEDGRRVQRVVEASGDAVVLHLRVAAEGDELRASAVAERRRPAEAVLREAVTAEYVQLLVQAAVDTGVELVRIELFGTLRDVVVPGTVLCPRGVRQLEQVQQVLGLGRQAVAGDDVARELLALAGSAGERVVDGMP